MSIVKTLIGSTFNKNIVQYAPLWTKAPDSSKTNVTQAKWFFKEKEIFTTNPHPRYNEESIIYTFNESGVRLYNKSGGPEQLACFGCSCTLGVGLPDCETWPYLLQEQMGSDNYTALNFGTAGSSIDYSCRLIYTYLQENKPYAVVCYFPEIFRKEYFSCTKKEMIHLALNMPEERMPTEKEFNAYCNLTNDYDCFLNFVKNFKFIQTLCKLYGVKFIWHTWSKFLLGLDIQTLKTFLGDDTIYIESQGSLLDIQKKHNLFKQEDYARDSGHPGLKHNTILANEFAKLLK